MKTYFIVPAFILPTVIFAAPLDSVGVATLRVQIDRARSTYRPVVGTLLEKRLRELETAWAAAQRFLTAAPERQRSEIQTLVGWKDLQAARAGGWKDRAALTHLSKGFYQTNIGLEKPELLKLREALDSYLHARWVMDGKTDADLQTQYVRNLAFMDRLLQEKLESLNVDALSAHASWMAAIEQAPALMAALHQAFISPNVIVVVAGKMWEAAPLAQPKVLNQSQISRNRILGHEVVGPSTLTGQVKGSVVTGAKGACLRLTVQGSIASPSNTAYAGIANVYSRGTTAVTGHQDVCWDGSRFVPLPPVVTAAPQSEITGAQSNRRRILFPNRHGLIDRMIEKGAVKQANQAKPQAQLEAKAIAEKNVRAQLENGVQERLKEMNGNVDYYYTHPLGRVGMIPKSNAVKMGSGMAMQFRFEDLAGMGAPSAPVFGPAGDIDVYIHESAMANILRPYSGGGLWQDTFFARIQKEATGDYTPEMRIEEGGPDRWALDLDWARPWTSKISAGGIELVLRAKGLQYRGETYVAAIEVRSTYQPVSTGADDVGFERVGELTLKTQTPLPAEVETFLKTKLEGFLPPTFHLDGLAAPAGGPWDTLSRMKLDRFELQQGWLCGRFRGK